MKALFVIVVAGIALAAGPSLAAGWSGCYVGGNVGGAWSHKSFHYGTENEGSGTFGGFAGGGQVGCDYQVTPNWLFGVQGMFDGSSISGTDFDPNDTDSYSTNINWFGTVTGRIGYLFTPSFLLYGKGGVAFVNENHRYYSSPNFFDGQTGNFGRTGWDAGLGAEWMFAPRWSTFLEYDHMGFGDKTVSFGGFSERISQSVDKVLVGINWRLGPQ